MDCDAGIFGPRVASAPFPKFVIHLSTL